MGLEVATYVASLVSSNPVGGSDQKAQGDDHIRLLKAVLQSTFPNASKAFYFPQILSKSADYSLLVGDGSALVLVNTSGATRTISLPNTGTITAGWSVTIFKAHASNSLVIDTPGGETIKGANSQTLTSIYDFLTLMWDGTEWDILSYGDVARLGSANTFTAAITVQALLEATKAFRLSGRLTPAQITANQNDYAPTDHATATVFRLDADAARDITGLAGGADGRIVLLDNIGSNTITLKHGSGSSSAANRFNCPGAVDYTLKSKEVVVLWYDGVTSLWQIVAPQLPVNPSYAHYQNQQTSGTNGPTYTNGAWRTVTLNTEVYDADGIGSLSSNQITLQAGTYEIWWGMTATRNANTTSGRSRIYNATDTTPILQGLNQCGSGSGVGGDEVGSRGHGFFTLSGAKAIELQYYCSVSTSTNTAVSTGEVEIYADVLIKKVSPR